MTKTVKVAVLSVMLLSETAAVAPLAAQAVENIQKPQEKKRTT